jgi:hypothetical protein
MVFMKREALSSMYLSPLIDPATLERAKIQVPASALLLNHPALLRFLKFIISLPPPQNHTWAGTTAWSCLKASDYAKGCIVWPVNVPLQRI